MEKLEVREEVLETARLRLLPAYWHRGYATEAAQAALELIQRPVWAATDVPNTASVRMLERLGMTFERREELNGRDTVFYRLTR